MKKIEPLNDFCLNIEEYINKNNLKNETSKENFLEDNLVNYLQNDIDSKINNEKIEEGNYINFDQYNNNGLQYDNNINHDIYEDYLYNDEIYDNNLYDYINILNNEKNILDYYEILSSYN